MKLQPVVEIAVVIAFVAALPSVALAQGRPVEHPVGADETCMECHDDLLDGRIKHMPAEDEGCDFCHLVEGSDDAFTVRTDDTDAICLDCHDDIGDRMAAGQMHAILEDDACNFCHSPHSSENSRLLLQPVDLLCADCHDVAAELESMPVVHGALADGDSCAFCHEPHGSEQPKLLLQPMDTLCGDCHEVSEQLESRAVKHQPVAELGCALCHTPHAGENEFLLPAPVNDLCLTCHGQAVEGVEPLALAADPAYVQGSSKIHLDANRVFGHPSLAHPVTDPPESEAMREHAEMFPDLNLVPEGRPRLTCGSCHEPHAANIPKLGRDREDLCTQCHL